MIWSMTASLHIIDRTTPADMLDQLSLLAGVGDVIASVGPPPACGGFRLPVASVHRTMGLARSCGQRLARIAGRTRFVHTWSLQTLGAARAAACKRGCPLLLSLPHVPARGRLAYLLKEAGRGDLTVTVPTESSRRRLLGAGVPDRVVMVLPPPAATVENRGETRRRVRSELGLDDGDILIAAPAEMTRHAGHVCASWAHGLLRQMLPNLRLILPGGGPVSSHVAFFAATAGYDSEVFLTEDRYDGREILSAADVAVFFFERDSGTAAIAAAMAAGLPIAATATPDVAELCTHEQTALLAAPGDPRLAAAVLLRLIEHGDLARSLSANARKCARERFDPEYCRGRLDELREASQGRLRAIAASADGL